MENDNRRWIRRDKTTGACSYIDRLTVAARMSSVYQDFNAAMAQANEKTPLTNGIAEYWPEEK